MPRPARRRLRPARDGVRDRGALVRRMGSWRPVVGTHRPRKMEPREPCRQVEDPDAGHHRRRSEEHTSELQSLMRISYAVFCLKKKIAQLNTIKKLSTMKTIIT